MDHISFGVANSTLEDYLTTNIYVNGIDLRVIISEIEANQLTNSRLSVQSGAYEGISTFIAFHLYDHFCKVTMNEYRYDGDRFALYDYLYSGIPGDHSLSCQIDIEKDRVIRSDFKNFSRFYPQGFNYRDLQYTFDRQAYLDAIAELRRDKVNPIYA
ncbi:MAG: hypothetical protein ACFB15_24390 [Cyclobacteriaceae bacterium]